MSGELGRGRATLKSMRKKSVHIKMVPSQIKMAVTNQGMGDLPLSHATTPISESTTNQMVIELTEGMGSFTIVGQPIEVITQDGSCRCCKVMVVCRSNGQGAGCKYTITEAPTNAMKPMSHRVIATFRRVCALLPFTPPASVLSSPMWLPGRLGVLSIVSSIQTGSFRESRMHCYAYALNVQEEAGCALKVC